MQFTKSNIITFALILLVYAVIFIFVQKWLPDAQTIIGFIEKLYRDYGYPIIFIGAFLEGLFLIGNYVPGLAVIFMGAALSRTGIVDFQVIILLGVLGLTTAYFINYQLGRYGWYHVLEKFGLHEGLEKAKERIHKNQLKAIFLGYAVINIASFVSTAAGVMKLPLVKFMTLSFLAQTIWSLAWGSLAYWYGLQLVELMVKYFGYVIFGIGLIWLIKHVFKKI